MLKTIIFSAAALMFCSATLAQPPFESPDRLEPQLDLIGDSAAVKPLPASSYWLGIWCSPVPTSLRMQLDLPPKQGVLVEGAAPDSPAAKAGLARFDVLLRAGEKPLTQPPDLVNAVEAAKGGKLRIELLRGGKPKTLEVTPEKRPEAPNRQVGEAPRPGDWETMDKWMREMWRGREGDARQLPFRFRMFHPGAIVPPGVLESKPLPSDMSITIRKEGDQPAKINVKQGEKTWDATEKELDKLPPEVRTHVERLLGHRLEGIVGGALEIPEKPEAFSVPVPGPDIQPFEPGAMDRIEQRFNAMDRRIDKLFEALDRNLSKTPEKPKEK
jgi:serine protease Do